MRPQSIAKRQPGAQHLKSDVPVIGQFKPVRATGRPPGLPVDERGPCEGASRGRWQPQGPSGTGARVAVVEAEAGAEGEIGGRAPRALERAPRAGLGVPVPVPKAAGTRRSSVVPAP
jgi:hypothetical protein